MRSFILLLSVLYACTATAQLPFKEIDKSIGRKDVVVYGEASHFLNSNHTAATELFKYLVVEKGFRVLVLESAWAIQSAVANYFSSNVPINSLYLNAFNSRQTNELIEWVRTFNYENPSDTITITGIQPEQPITDINNLRSALGVLPPILDTLFRFSNDLDAVINSSKQWKSGHTILSDTIRKLTLKEISTLLPKLSGDAKISAISLSGYIDVLTRGLDESNNKNHAEYVTQMIYQKGDSVRMMIFEALSEQYFPHKKVFFWMHNWHAATQSQLLRGDVTNGHPPLGTRSIGVLLKHKYKDRMISIGSITPKIGENVIAGEIDQSFNDHFGTEITFIPASHHYTVKTKGSLLSPVDKSLIHNYDLFMQYDGVLYLPHTGYTF